MVSPPRALRKGLGADFADIGSLSRVQSHMLSQIAGVIELALARLARVLFFSGMDPFVLLHVALIGKLSRTDLAGIGLLPRVHADVADQIRGSPKPLHAQIARKGLLHGVGFGVTGEGRFRRKPSLADFAFKGLLPRVAAAMVLQETGSEQHLETNVAREDGLGSC